MDIEQLTKAQTVLLVLLVSFVTSIATGIVTVTLLDQAPPAVTQTINRVVERTVERVAPENQGAAAATTVTTTEKTIVVKEEDLITESIEKNTKHLVRLYKAAPAEGNTSGFLGFGIIVTRGGVIAVDAASVAQDGTYSVTVADGTVHTANVVQKRADSDIALLAIETPDGDETTFSPAAFASQNSLKLGQTVLALGGRDRVNVATGIISGFTMTEPVQSESTENEGEKEGESDAKAPTIALIETTITDGRIQTGSPALTIFGEVAGLATSAARQAGSSGAYTPIEDIRGELSALLDSSQSQESDSEGAAD